MFGADRPKRRPRECNPNRFFRADRSDWLHRPPRGSRECYSHRFYRIYGPHWSDGTYRIERRSRRGLLNRQHRLFRSNRVYRP